jgi:hypothetical protein
MKIVCVCAVHISTHAFLKGLNLTIGSFFYTHILSPTNKVVAKALQNIVENSFPSQDVIYTQGRNGLLPFLFSEPPSLRLDSFI